MVIFSKVKFKVYFMALEKNNFVAQNKPFVNLVLLQKY